jgi:flavin-dependent dehydrogenase
VEESLHRGGDYGGIDYPVLSFGYLDYGYAWLFPNRDRLVAGIGGLKRKDTGKNLARCFKTFLADFELNGRDSIKIQGHPLPFGNFLRKPVYEKILLVGDAAGLVDPLLGEGIYQAHRSGELAAQAVIENKNSDGAAIAHNYLDLLNTHLLPEFLWARRYRWFAYNRLNHIFKFRSVKLVEGRFDKLVELIHGVRSYKRPWLEKTEYI